MLKKVSRFLINFIFLKNSKLCYGLLKLRPTIAQKIKIWVDEILTIFSAKNSLLF
jgi:hypothetical protein